MKRIMPRILIILVGTALLLFSCTKTTNQPTPPSEEVVLTYLGTSGPKYLQMSDILALPSTEAMGGIISSTGQITIPELYKGISLKDLIEHFNETFDTNMGVTLTAVDGYSMTYSYDQVMNGEFPAYDPATGSELFEHDPLTPILAYERNGELLDPVEDGYLRLVIVSERNNQVTDGHWSIKWVNKIEVGGVNESWTLELEGAVSSTIDRSSYQSCASPGCHGVDWQDENNQTWEGVPLWLLIGEVDDQDRHSDYAYNEELANEGYSIDLVAGDDYTVTFTSLDIKQNGNIIVAYLVNGTELPEKYYPLRLVGSDLENSEMVGNIVKISLDIPEPFLPTPSSNFSISGDLVIKGLVDRSLGFSDADLHASTELVTITAEHPKNGLQEYTGVRFYSLFQMAGVNAVAQTVVLSASDGFSTEISLTEIQACCDCLVAFTNTPGEYNAILPGYQSSYWIKNLVLIEVK